MVDNLIDDSESGTFLPEIEVEAYLTDHEVYDERVEATSGCFVHERLTLDRRADQLGDPLLAIQAHQ